MRNFFLILLLAGLLLVPLGEMGASGNTTGDILNPGPTEAPPVSGGLPKQPSNWFGGSSGVGLPLHDSFQAASVSLGWALGNTYLVFLTIVAIALGIAVFIASGSILAGGLGVAAGFAIGSGVKGTDGVGVVPLWIAIVFGLIGIFSIIIRRST